MTEPAQSRIAFLRERVDIAERSANRTTFDVPFRQRTISLVKIDVPIGFPLYNIQSGRTHRSQTEWIEQNNRAKDFFADPEDDEVQRVQNELLLTMIRDRGLAEDLERRDQRNPVVLTYDGFIVDGNRRVAALREQGGVENVVAVVLPPDATRTEVFETELELQMARETRAEYNWIDQALHIRYGVRQLEEPVASVAQRMNVPEREVNEMMLRLSLVDQYLGWLGTPDAYHRVPSDSEQSFVELADRESRQQFRNLPELQRRAGKQACFGVIQVPGGGYMDVRRVADFIRSKPNDVVSRTRERLPAELARRLDEPVATQENAAGDDILAQLASAGGDEGVPAGAQLLNVVTDPADARASAPILIEVALELDQEQREAQTHLEPLRNVEKALRYLRAVRIGEETQRLDEIAARVADVIEVAEGLAAEINDHSAQSE